MEENPEDYYNQTLFKPNSIHLWGNEPYLYFN